MNAESGSGSSGTFVWGLIAGIAVVVVAGGLYLSGIIGGGPNAPAPEAEVAAQSEEDSTAPVPIDPAVEAPTTPAKDEQASDALPDDDAQADVAPQVTLMLDQIFVEPDGSAVLSGSAEPGAEVNVLLDGESVHSFMVDASGQFAEFVSIPFSDTARGLTLETQGDQSARSDDYVIAALPKPESAEEPASAAEAAEGSVAEADNAEVAEVAEPDQPATSGTADTDSQLVEDEIPQVAEAATPEATDQQVAILRSGEDGVELVQGPTSLPQTPDQVALDTIGYSDAGEVELTGRVPDGSVVRLYLNNRLVDDQSPANDGKWRSELEGVEPGVYTLRVDEVGADGTVVSRLETPFKRESPDVLRAAEATDEPDLAPNDAPIRSVTVQRGDTLWAISRERFGDGILYVRLFEANRDSIRDPDLIYPGQIFTIPE
ncbi:MAG: LysM peptidoglycan-binding domain-containing protein [Ruegeria sp.]|nr:LysM peptidoglycan-binding domain-containing protein [Ruegeria sp.]